MAQWWDTCHHTWQPELISRPHVVKRSDSKKLSTDLHSPAAPHTTQSKQMNAIYPSISFPMPLYSPSTSKKRNNFFFNCIFHIFIPSYSLHIRRCSFSMWRLHRISFVEEKVSLTREFKNFRTRNEPFCILCFANLAGHWNYKVRSLCVMLFKVRTDLLPLSSFQVSVCCNYSLLSGHFKMLYLLPSQLDVSLLLPSLALPFIHHSSVITASSR